MESLHLLASVGSELPEAVTQLGVALEPLGQALELLGLSNSFGG
jgi:hypothetical protein